MFLRYCLQSLVIVAGFYLGMGFLQSRGIHFFADSFFTNHGAMITFGWVWATIVMIKK
jgi:hypothetical protein